MSPYIKWLSIIALISAVVSTYAYGLLSDVIPVWFFPASLIFAFLATVNGDSLIESVILLFIFAVVFVPLHLLIADRYGFTAIIPSLYIALFLSKILFALAKDGKFGNESFK